EMFYGWTRFSRWLAVAATFLILIGGSANSSCATTTSTASSSNLPDPLIMLDGSQVQSRSDWFHKRRPELLNLFAKYMYGAIPPKPPHMTTKVVGNYDNFLDGKAKLKLVRLEFPELRQSALGSLHPALSLDLMLVLPKNGPHPAPVFLAMDFC